MSKLLAAAAASCLIATAVYAAKPVGAPPSSQAESAWFTQAFIPGIGGCCSTSDGFREGIHYPEERVNHPHPEGIILQEWKHSPDKPGEYDIRIVGNQWIHVEKKNVLPPIPANPTGGAVAFMTFNYGFSYSPSTNPFTGGVYTPTGQYSVYLRCFSPGNEL